MYAACQLAGCARPLAFTLAAQWSAQPSCVSIRCKHVCNLTVVHESHGRLYVCAMIWEQSNLVHSTFHIHLAPLHTYTGIQNRIKQTKPDELE